MQKILMLCRLYSPHVGGVEKHVAELSRELIKGGYEVTVITEQYRTGLAPEEKIEGVRVKRIPYQALKSKRGVWAWMKAYRELVEAADLVHIHDVFWWYLPTRLTLWAKPVFITFHGYEGSGPPRWQAVVQRKVAEKMCRGSICIGGFMKKWYRAKPDEVLYGAADCRPKAWTMGRKAIYLGRLSEDAGILTYLKAIYLIKPRIEMTVLGKGPQEKEAKEYARKKDLEVGFEGAVTDGAQRLGGVRWAMVSRYLAILEAMQTKRLVLAVYNNEIKRDYLNCHPQAKNMIITGTAEELAVKLMALTEAQEKTMIDEAYEWAKKQTWGKLAKEYQDLWNRMDPGYPST